MNTVRACSGVIFKGTRALSKLTSLLNSCRQVHRQSLETVYTKLENSTLVVLPFVYVYFLLVLVCFIFVLICFIFVLVCFIFVLVCFIFVLVCFIFVLVCSNFCLCMFYLLFLYVLPFVFV